MRIVGFAPECDERAGVQTEAPTHSHSGRHIVPIYTNTTGLGALLPDAFGPLLVEPMAALSVAMNPAVAKRLDVGSHQVNIPTIAEDPSAAWVAEGAELLVSDATFTETSVVPSKLGSLMIVSRECAEDSNPAVQEIIGHGLARDLAKKVDAALFSTITPANAPAGMGSLLDVTEVDAGAAYTNTDWAAEAISEAEQVGATVTSFMCSPATALTLAKLKDETGSNRPLLGNDPTTPTGKVVAGVPLISTPAIVGSEIYALDGSRVFTILRKDVELEVSTQVYFTSDRVAIRGIIRVGFAYPSHKSIVKIDVSS
jgi:HK97 family phage major capsid protein